ncbi:hypothetical protein GUITHDRAFT_137081 [Guillardia theta CCMP2712]|uniref:FZ domain-containing protein n=1 Tax=Guillardia theta (strain CCMP2712) TaxID=905079 RepID=L1JJ77_GUITC|nr:hypothetical protein GUITHDRAFT_137081 [Guillardia theta CCMP2712]EKX48145.1 hypothetical protein GUITHDRAFT_137081 [Guillardia theta CCMP2712]|eukprot:XP_005835125.1 hypothetical protein GUITHDRAFT_137081 [Guillardia theta CCMP2712]
MPLLVAVRCSAPPLLLRAIVRIEMLFGPRFSQREYCPRPGAVPADFTTAMNLAVKRLSVSQVCTSDFRVCFPGVSCLGGECNPGPNTMSIPCELALRRAVCAYHFPRCVNDYLIFSYEVCRETCEDVSIYCNITLDEVVNIPRCTDRNFGCTGGAGMLGLTKWATLAMSMIGWRITHLYM